MTAPIIEDIHGIKVVRDDLYPGGTKARFLRPFMQATGAAEYVYASPCEGGAQTSLCLVAKEMGVKATIFVAKRADQHPRIKMDKKLGGKVVQVPYGYLNVVQAAATKYASKKGRFLMPFGFDLPQAVQEIANAALATGETPDEIWCASGSGTLARGLALAWPAARLNVVQVGKTLTKKEVGKAKIHIYPKPFGWACSDHTPFPTDFHYESKAWQVLQSKKHKGKVLFWSVMCSPNVIQHDGMYGPP